MSAQPYIPGLQPPTGWLFERLREGYDIQVTGDRYAYWEEAFSRDRPEEGRTVRNVCPVFRSSTVGLE